MLFRFEGFGSGQEESKAENTRTGAIATFDTGCLAGVRGIKRYSITFGCF
jgi:hypothetical protein